MAERFNLVQEFLKRKHFSFFLGYITQDMGDVWLFMIFVGEDSDVDPDRRSGILSNLQVEIFLRGPFDSGYVNAAARIAKRTINGSLSRDYLKALVIQCFGFSVSEKPFRSGIPPKNALIFISDEQAVRCIVERIKAFDFMHENMLPDRCLIITKF